MTHKNSTSRVNEKDFRSTCGSSSLFRFLCQHEESIAALRNVTSTFRYTGTAFRVNVFTRPIERYSNIDTRQTLQRDWDLTMRHRPYSETETLQWDKDLAMRQRPYSETETLQRDRDLTARQRPYSETETLQRDWDLQWDRDLTMRRRPYIETETLQWDWDLTMRLRPYSETEDVRISLLRYSSTAIWIGLKAFFLRLWLLKNFGV